VTLDEAYKLPAAAIIGPTAPAGGPWELARPRRKPGQAGPGGVTWWRVSAWVIRLFYAGYDYSQRCTLVQRPYGPAFVCPCCGTFADMLWWPGAGALFACNRCHQLRAAPPAPRRRALNIGLT
jgi:hypothetical protein